MYWVIQNIVKILMKNTTRLEKIMVWQIVLNKIKLLREKLYNNGSFLYSILMYYICIYYDDFLFYKWQKIRESLYIF